MIKYSNKIKAVLIEIDMVHGDIYNVMIFQSVFAAIKYCENTYKATDWSDSGNVMLHYIDETRRLNISHSPEVEAE
jgi:hypothetical protein